MNPAGIETRDRAPIREVTLSRTWELELFISGATVFALLQAPGIVDRWFTHTDPHLAGTMSYTLFFAYYYAKLILYTLIATFLLHLVTRAYWVGLVGLHSVYPGGVRWEEMKFGPAFQRVYRERMPELAPAVDRIDNVSSLLFSGGALILLFNLTSVLMVAVIALLAFAISAVLFGGEHFVPTVGALLLIVMMVPLFAKSLDSWHAKRAGADAEPPPALLRAAKIAYYANAMPVIGPLLLVISSNLGKRRANAAITVVFFSIIGIFVVRDVLIGNDVLRADSHRFLPDERALQFADPSYYMDRRDRDVVYVLTPAIQSELITGPYIRLFIPMTPERHNPLIGERCPEAPAFETGLRMRIPAASSEPPNIEALLNCVAGFQPIALDGVPIGNPGFSLTRDSASGLMGLLTYIPVAGLGPGEHVLRIEGLPRATTEAGRAPRPPAVIRFWI